MTSLLAVKDLQVEFVTRDGIVKAVNGVSFTLERGKVLTILGESGSGKSVTMRSLVRLLPSVRTRINGEIILKGRNLYALSEAEVQNLLIRVQPVDVQMDDRVSAVVLVNDREGGARHPR